VVSASSTSYDLNDASLVLKVQIDGINLLFTGDITQKRERILMKEGADVQCQLLHVPHHGSGTSCTSAFINATEAKAAVISSGERNRFGHPHQDTLLRLDEAGLSVFRTDLQGAIFLIIKERTGTITSWLGD
jgi:competence protein ComEC